MRAVIFSVIVGGLIGGGLGFAIGIFAYPYIFLADIVAQETVGDVASKKVVANGDSFMPIRPIPCTMGKVL
tara:strand:+ start:1849 stop:2061 length:213 start_codon:yes stop_codon:yes gene_type:complete